jgi:thermopsin
LRTATVAAVVLLLLVGGLGLRPDLVPGVPAPPHGAASAARAGERPLGGSNPNQPIDPYAVHIEEPAPMGVADIGLTTTSQPYNYSTMGLLGTASITSLAASNDTARAATVLFELDAMLVLGGPSQRLVYWVQDLARVNTSTGWVGFADKVWNASSPGAVLHWPWIAGNGSTVSAYSYTPGPAFPGNEVERAVPFALSLRLWTGVTNATPTVLVAFDDGQGWQTFDTVRFHYAMTWADLGFWVNGSTLAPDSQYYDAELVATSPSPGGSLALGPSYFTLGLGLDNGHNYQAVPNAWDFGLDAPGGLSDVMATDQWNSSGGVPVAALSSGAGDVGPLYDRAYLGDLVVDSNLTDGTLAVDGNPIPYSGGEANLTLGPGTYSLDLLRGAGTVANGSAAVRAGVATVVQLDPVPPPPPAGLKLPGGATSALIVVALVALAVVLYLWQVARWRPFGRQPPPVEPKE